MMGPGVLVIGPSADYVSGSVVCYTKGLEGCPLPKRVGLLQSLDFTVNRVLMKLFISSHIALLSNSAYISFMSSYHPYSFGCIFKNFWQTMCILSLKLLLLCIVRCPIVMAIFDNIVICPIAIAYSMGQFIKSVCVCQCICLCICPSASTLTVAFLDQFSPKLALT